MTEEERLEQEAHAEQKKKVDKELDRLVARMRKRGVQPACVVALWFNPGPVPEGKTPKLGATISVCGAGDSGLSEEFIYQNSIYGLDQLSKMVINNRPDLFMPTPGPDKTH